jgi:hypothetical protein
MAHPHDPAGAAHQGLILDHVGADRPLFGLSNRGLMWVQ